MFLAIHKPIPESVSLFIEALKSGSVVAIAGLAAALIALIVVIAAVLFVKKKSAHALEAVSEDTIAVIPAAEETPAEETPLEEEPEPAADDTAVIAAIIAAISAHTGKAPTSFRVVSFKRRH